MKVVVTGAGGFIGSHIVDALVQAGASVIGIDSLDPGIYRAPPPYLNEKAEYCVADLRYWSPDSRFDDTEVVVHLAALGGVSRAGREPENVIGANCLGTARLVSATRNWSKLRRVVLCSSFSIYGANYTYRCSDCGLDRDGSRRDVDLAKGQFEVLCSRCEQPATIVPITERAPPNPLETYGASKFMQELCFRGFQAAPLTTLRFSSVYGTRLRLDDGEATIIARIAGWIRSGASPQLFEDGRQIRDWVYVGDIVSVVRALLEPGQHPDVINICSGVPTTLEDACKAIAVSMGSRTAPVVVGGYRSGDMRHCLGDASTVESVLGRTPITLNEGAKLAFG